MLWKQLSFLLVSLLCVREIEIKKKNLKEKKEMCAREWQREFLNDDEGDNDQVECQVVFWV